VELLNFTADRSGRNVVLKWETASEKDNDHFTLERSADGITYTAIGTIPGAGTSTVAHAYAYTDFNPGSGVLYYRLKQTDLNGSTTYSDPVSVVADGLQGNAFSVYPNPNNGSFRVRYGGSDETPVEVTVSDAYGRTVYQNTLSVAELRTTGIQLQDFPEAGYYTVRFAAEQLVESTVIVVE
jgi:hypothetical protein